MRRLLIVALLIAIAWGAWRDWQLRPVSQPPGVLVADEPRQFDVGSGARPFDFHGFSLQPVAGYRITARLLSREEYSAHRESELSPLDFALGWGPMSDSAILDRLEVDQSSRYFTLHWREPPLPPDVLLLHAANTHLIPADAQVRKALDKMRPGQVVALEGLLVNASAQDGWAWKSSLTRSDTGAGACELFWVEQSRVIQ
jgi:hypothetical protein